MDFEKKNYNFLDREHMIRAWYYHFIIKKRTKIDMGRDNENYFTMGMSPIFSTSLSANFC